MNGNCRANYIVQSYIKWVREKLDVSNRETINIKVTNSISRDAINQILLHEKTITDILKHTLKFSTFSPVIELCDKALGARGEIISDVKDISKFCCRFRNTPVGIKNYNQNFRTIMKDAIDKQKSIGYKRNLNVYFLNLMLVSNSSCILMLQNLLRHRICPQLRLIGEYMICLNRREIIKMKDILNLPV